MSKGILSGYELRQGLQHWQVSFLVVLETTIPVEQLRSRLAKFDITLADSEPTEKPDRYRVTLGVMEVESLSAEERLGAVFALLGDFGLAEEISRKRLDLQPRPKRGRVRVETEVSPEAISQLSYSELRGKLEEARQLFLLYCEQANFESAILNSRIELLNRKVVKKVTKQ